MNVGIDRRKDARGAEDSPIGLRRTYPEGLEHRSGILPLVPPQLAGGSCECSCRLNSTMRTRYSVLPVSAARPAAAGSERIDVPVDRFSACDRPAGRELFVSSASTPFAKIKAGTEAAHSLRKSRLCFETISPQAMLSKLDGSFPYNIAVAAIAVSQLV